MMIGIGFKDAARELAVTQKRLRKLIDDGVVIPGAWVQTSKEGRMRRWMPEDVERARQAISEHENRKTPEEIMAAERQRIATLIESHAEEMLRKPDPGCIEHPHERRSAAYARVALMSVAQLIRGGYQDWSALDNAQTFERRRHDRMIAEMKAQEAIDD